MYIWQKVTHNSYKLLWANNCLHAALLIRFLFGLLAGNSDDIQLYK